MVNPYCSYWHIEGIEGIGIKYPRGRGITGIYSILCRLLSLPHVKVPDAKAAAEVLEGFDVDAVNKTLPLFDPTTLPIPSQSFLQDMALHDNVVYCGSALNGRGSREGTFIHRPNRLYLVRRGPCVIRMEDLNRRR